ncbi:glycosyltransferase family 17 protein [Desarmillaria tabescens]|uniref:Glycosyltransferase family 17 protein n=1 Tax=Armillaria tabescens TaxID=1929756 RepID=A0AA39TJB3_ARMTA|nr:glycosyltransferase family 17 protein [Desarmillaria tabescens]KAK0461052.1 glycosyltransferase family 17 protein [Desarmillaria tabescens]
MSMRRQRLKAFLFPSVVITGVLLYFVSQYHYQIRNTISYATRPIWDTADGPQHVIPHYYGEGLEMDEHTCQLHGWKQRPDAENYRLDLLEIRMNELDSVVDRFFIVESNATFTGLPKETYFANNRARFSKFDKKISYRFLPGYPLKEGQTAWNVEAKTRDTMTAFLRSHMTEFAPTTRPLVIMSDVDEIPSSHTLRLLKSCDFGTSIHLQLRSYVYSFEWFLGFNSWRASVNLWMPSTYYSHRKSGDVMLADSGWHCSYCFRTIPEYVTKMTGFSHHDRIGGQLSLLDPQRIQDTICKGKDIFGMLPEAFSYVDLLAQINPEPQVSAVNLPRFLIEAADRFKFLLPGGCQRTSQTIAEVEVADALDDLER